jgi:DNA-binding response OmpR family regulator
MERILLIDDEQHIRDRFEREFSDDGYAVYAVGSRCDFMKRIEFFKPKLVILDIRIGSCDGLEILEQIRDAHPDLPVILWSAYDSYKFETRAIGADYYVLKSFDLTELKSRVKMSLETSLPAMALSA